MNERGVLRPEPARIAVVRALQLGDMLCAVPALRALRSAAPNAHISLIGLPWACEFVRRFGHYVDEFIEFPGYPGLPERAWEAGAFARFLQQMQLRHFDLVLQLHGDGRVLNGVVALMGPSRSAGYYRTGGYCPDPESFIAWREGEHEIVRWLRLLEELGAPARGRELEFPLSDEDVHEARRLAQQAGVGAPYVCLHPGSQLASRRWAPERFARVGDALADCGYAVAITGTAAEAGITGCTAGAMRSKAIDLAGRTSLGAAAGLVRDARLLVCNDTGVSHIAAALGTPSVVVSCGSDPARWAPLDRARHPVLYQPIACRPCSYALCPIGHPCAEALHAHAAIDAALQLLARTDTAPKDLHACVP